MKGTGMLVGKFEFPKGDQYILVWLEHFLSHQGTSFHGWSVKTANTVIMISIFIS